MFEISVIATKALDVAFPDALRRVMGKRAELAFDTLMHEFAIGNRTFQDVAESDASAAKMLKFFQAASHGASADKLRILARLLAHEDERPDRSADEYVMWADMIGTLLPEEPLFLARLYKCFDRDGWTPNDKDQVRIDRLAQKFAEEITDGSPMFSDFRDMQMVGNALVRTGLVRAIQTADGGARFAPTRRLWALERMARLSEFGPEYGVHD